MITAAFAHRRPNTASFAVLQERLPAIHASACAGAPRTLVVVPSRTIDKWREPPGETQAYEERLLCTLLELRDPSVRVTYVTAHPVTPAIIDYYLSLLPARARTDARRRLTLVALADRERRPLSQKLLDRPAVLARVRASIPPGQASWLVPYTTTGLERDLAVSLQIPMYGADPAHAHLGTKSGGRALFARCGVPHPLGVEDIRSVQAAIQAIARLRAAKPELSRVVVKLNDGVSGEGNALVELAQLPRSGSAEEAARIAERLADLRPEANGVTASAFLSKLATSGGVVEEWIAGPGLRSPSAQLNITPSGEVQLVSTHDQILGGPGGQNYLGCRFPAAPAYAPLISRHARAIGARLAAVGVVGRCAIDFVVTCDAHGDWSAFAIELNLRKGGTTHPFETLSQLTGGSYDAATATFRTPAGAEKHYVATDHFEGAHLAALGSRRFVGLLRRDALGFDPMRRVGCVWHMLSSVDGLGRTGYTAIADSAQEAEELSRRVEGDLRSAAARAGREANFDAVADRPGILAQACIG